MASQSKAEVAHLLTLTAIAKEVTVRPWPQRRTMTGATQTPSLPDDDHINTPSRLPC